MKRLVVMLGCLLVATVTARAGDWFPLTGGMLWRYVSVNGDGSQTRYVSGTTTIFGRPTVEIETFREGPQVEHFRRYWSRDEDGNLLLVATRGDGGSGVVYDPPLLFMRNSQDTLVTGDQWTSTVHVYYGWPPQHETCQDTLTFYCRVGEPDTITVPAGTFPAYAVLHDIADRKGAQTADRLAELPPVVTRSLEPMWYASGVGLVKDGTFELVDLPTGDRPLSWGDLKRRYR